MFFPAKDYPEVEAMIPDGHILGVRALGRRKWKVWLMTDVLPTHRRVIVWHYDHVMHDRGADAALWALRKHATPAVTVTADAAGNVLDIDG